MPSPSPRRIRVVGVSGSGKTWLAAAAAQRLGVAHLELDAVFWDANWTFRDVEDARRMVRAFVAAHPDGWVADGNWTSRLDGLLDPPHDADLMVWLDHPRWLVMAQVVARTLVRGITGRELWHGNRERPSNWFSRDPDQNIVLWAWRGHPVARERYTRLVGEPWLLRLTGRREVRRWLRSLPPASPPSPR